MSSERRRRLEAYNERSGAALSPTDVGIFARFVTAREPWTEVILWDNQESVRAKFDDLLAAADGDAQPAPLGPSALYANLRVWRDRHTDDSVRSVSDADLGRLAAAPLNSAEDLGRATAALRDGGRLIGYADELLRLVGLRRDVPADSGEARRAASASPGAPSASPEAAPRPAAAAPPRGPERAPAPQAPPAPPAPPMMSEVRPHQPAPAPRPEPQPAPKPEPQPDPGKPFVWVQVPRFKPFDWTSGKAEPQGHVVAESRDGHVEMQWTPARGEAPVTLYRIVSSPQSWPVGAPEMAAQQGVTEATAGRFPAVASGAITYYAVWAHQGASVLEASQSQPTLIGSTEVVWPPSSMTVNVTPEKKVAGTWNAPPGSRVEVQRFPEGHPVGYDQSRLLRAEVVRSGGFLDDEAPQGQVLRYAAFCVADLPSGGSATSAPTIAEITVTPEVQQVALSVRPSADANGTYDISWIPPAHGSVTLYALGERPPQGLEREPRPMATLEAQGVRPEFRITYPSDDLGGVRTIRGFVVDRTWVHAHFVAVHQASDEVAWMSAPASVVTPHPPQWVQVVERVDTQILAFPWPEGVAKVEAYQSPRGVAIDTTTSEPVAHLTRQDYDRAGGMRIARALPGRGCSLHVVGVVYLDGAPVHSAPVTVDYPGITRIRYELEPAGPDGRPAQPGTPVAYHHLFCTADDDLYEVPIMLVANDRRLPLEPSDGAMVRQAVISLGAGERVFVGALPAGPRVTWLRLFINRPPAEVGSIAVLDPIVDALRLQLGQ